MRLVANFWIQPETVRGLTKYLRVALGVSGGKLLSAQSTLKNLAKREQIGRYKMFLHCTIIGMIKLGFSDDEIERAICLMLERKETQPTTRANSQPAN